MQKLLIISGQTATGKTDLGVYLAKKFNGEIVSFDSRQAYKHLNIITGKDFDKNVKCQMSNVKTKTQNLSLVGYFKNNVPIWLYDLYDPKEYINAYDFCQRAEIVVDDVIKRGRLPIIVGGTAFYIKSFLQGFESWGTEPNWELRKKLEKLTVEELQKELKTINKERFLKMNQSDRNNKRRLIRAIEIGNVKLVDKKFAQYDRLFSALVLDKEKLKKKIEKRVKKRIKEGAIEEVKKLLATGYSFDDPGMNTLGYKQLKDYFEDVRRPLEKKVVLQEAINNWTKAEIDYARRQLVFLKKTKQVVFLNPEDKDFLAKTKNLVYKWFNESKD